MSNDTGSAVLPLADIIAQIKEELARAESAAPGGSGLALKKVTVEVSLATTRDASGDLKVGVPLIKTELSGDTKLERSETSKLSVALEPPPANLLKSADRVDLSGFDIAGTIVETRRQLQQGLDQPPHLVPSSLALEIAFGVTHSISGKGGVNLVVVKFGGGASAKDAALNKISLQFGRAGPG